MEIINTPTKVGLTHILTKPDYQLALDLMRQKLVLKDYSKHTIKTYMHMFKQFLRYIHPMPLHQVGTSHIMHYHNELVTKRNVSA